MRIGAIFARGSCRALKWTALAGVVFALGVGSAAAQVTDIDLTSISVDAPSNTVQEGGSATVTVVLNKVLPSSAGATIPLVIGYPNTGGQGAKGNAESGETTGDVVDVVVAANVLIAGGSDRGSVTATFGVDLDAVDEEFSFDATDITITGDTTAARAIANPADVSTGKITIVDRQEQNYRMVLTATASTVKEGGTTDSRLAYSMSLTAQPKRPTNEQQEVFLSVPSKYNTVSSGGGDLASVTLDNNDPATGEAFSVRVPINDENRTDDVVTVKGYTRDTVRNVITSTEIVSAEFTVLDIHQLPMPTAIAGEARSLERRDLGSTVTAVKEGDDFYLWVTVANRTVGDRVSEQDDFRVAVTAANPAQMLDYRMTPPAENKLGAGGGTTPKRVGPWKFEILTDEDVGTEELKLNLNVSGNTKSDTVYYGPGTSTGTFSIDLEDTTKKQVTPVSEEAAQAAVDAAVATGGGDEGLNPGESFTVMAGDLFNVSEGYSATYAASASGDHVVGVSSSGDSIMITANKAGMSTVTVVANARMAVSSATTSQTVADRAEVSFDVEVKDKKLVVTVAADPTAVDEGGTSRITATANRMVVADDGEVTVNLQVVGPATLDEESITIGTDADSGYVTLTAAKDDDYDNETVTVIASGAASATIEITVNDNDTAPPETTYTLEASADMVAEGGDAVTITATASAAVEVNTEIRLVHGAGSSSADDYRLDPMVITIAAEGTMGTAMLTATDDTMVEGDETLTLNGMMGNVVVDSVMLTITDNDEEEPPAPPTVTAKDQSVVDAVFVAATGDNWMVGGSASVDMSALFESESTTLTYAGMSSDTGVVMATASGAMLSLSAETVGMATISVTATDTASGDSATASSDLTVNLVTLEVSVTADAMAIDEGGMATITAMANRELAAGEDVTLTLTVAGDAAAVTVEPDTLTIETGMMTGTATVTAVQDDDTANANVTVVVSGAALGGDTVSLSFAITDDDRTVVAKSQAEVDATFALAIGGDFLPGGDAATVDMSALFTMAAGASAAYEAMSSNEDSVMASASGSMLTLTPGETGSAVISVTATDSNGDADDTASVSSTVTVGVLPLAITSVTASASDVAEGGTVEITATANKAVDALVEVMLIRDAASSAGDDDYSLAPHAMISIMAGEAMGKVTLTATDDIETEPAESLTLIARVKDLGDVGTVMVTIAASDPMSMFTLSGGPADMQLMEGESYELTVTAAPAVQEDTEVPIMRDRAASDADEADYTVASVMLKAGDASGTTTLMVTDDGMDDSGHGMPEALVLYIADGGDNQRLSFNIWDAAVPALPVIAQLLLAAFLAIGGYRRYLRR